MVKEGGEDHSLSDLLETGKRDLRYGAYFEQLYSNPA